MTTRTGAAPWLRAALPGSLLALAILAVFGQAARFGFTSYDDGGTAALPGYVEGPSMCQVRAAHSDKRRLDCVGWQWRSVRSALLRAGCGHRVLRSCIRCRHDAAQVEAAFMA